MLMSVFSIVGVTVGIGLGLRVLVGVVVGVAVTSGVAELEMVLLGVVETVVTASDGLIEAWD